MVLTTLWMWIHVSNPKEISKIYIFLMKWQKIVDILKFITYLFGKVLFSTAAYLDIYRMRFCCSSALR